MEHRFDVKNALKVFSIVTERGEQTPDGYVYDGMTVREEYDGYTVTMTDGRVKLYIYFHNKYNFEFKRSEDLDTFIDHIERLGR